jgi:hypothetical protein
MVIAAEYKITYTPLRPLSPPQAHMYDTAPQRPRVGIPTLPTEQVAFLQDDYRVVDCRRQSAFIRPPIEAPALLPITLNIPPATNLTTPHMIVNVQMYPSLVAGATFNINIRNELRKPREEV